MPQAWQVFLRVWVTRCLLRVCGACVYLLAAADRRCPETRFAGEVGGETRLDVRNPNTGPGGVANPNPEMAANGNVTPALQTALQAASQAPASSPRLRHLSPLSGHSIHQSELVSSSRIAALGYLSQPCTLHHLLPSPSRLAEQSSPFSDCDCSHPYSLRWPRG